MRTPKRCETSSGEVFYEVRYRNPPGGPQRKMRFYGDTEAAALADANEFARLLASIGVVRAVQWWNANLGDEPGTREMTLDEWWPLHLESITGISEGTRDGYDRTYKRVWSPAIGRMPLSSITRPDIAKVVNARAKKVADKSVANEFVVLSGCLRAALLDGHIRAMPTEGIKLPRNTDHESDDMRFLTHAEWDTLHDALPEHYRPLFTFLVGTGCRWGEAEALTVGDIFQAPITLPNGDTVDRWQVRIVKAAKWNPSGAVRTVGPTKTRRGRRTITLPPEVISELAPLLARDNTERLFLALRGGPLRHKPVYDMWVKATAKAQLKPPPRIHDLRHTHVAWLIAAGVSLPVIQARLGHEQITTTIDRYGHLLPELEVQATEAASLAMRPRLELASSDGLVDQ